jgi:uncharacterized membrane protein
VPLRENSARQHGIDPRLAPGDNPPMNSFVRRTGPLSSGVKFAIACGILWVLSLIVIALAFRNGEEGGFFHFIARFHVLIVHFPIGILFVALLMEVASFFTVFSEVRKSVPFMLWVGFFASIKATVFGYLLMQMEDESGKAMTLHLWFGLAVVVFCLATLVLHMLGKRTLYGAALLTTVASTLTAGHFGGALVHSPAYLTEYAPPALRPIMELGLSEGASSTPGTPEGGGEPAAVPLAERKVYDDFVVPILAAKCTECHDANKIKGKLRLDTHELILAGAEGSEVATVKPGDVKASEMIVRVTLPSDEDEFMPPKGDGLTPEEIKLLSLWIEAGATQELTVAGLGTDPSIEQTVLAVSKLHDKSAVPTGDTSLPLASAWDSLAPEEQNTRLTEVNAAAERYHFSVMPLSADDARLRVNVINAAKEFGDDQLALLAPVADRIIWLDLARSQVTDAGMKTVALMRSLERLHLENTAITDAGVAQLAGLSQLEYLNLYNTKVGDAIFETFASMPKLRKIYVWQTGVTPAKAKDYEKAVNLEVNIGADLAAVAAPAEAAKAEAPAAKPEEKKPADAKPAEAKPAEAKPAEAKPAEAKPAEAKPAEAKPAAAKPAEAKPADAPPAPKPDPKPAENKPAEAKPAPAKPADTPPAPKPAEAKPAETKPVEKPADTPPAPKPADKPAL